MKSTYGVENLYETKSQEVCCGIRNLGQNLIVHIAHGQTKAMCKNSCDVRFEKMIVVPLQLR